MPYIYILVPPAHLLGPGSSLACVLQPFWTSTYRNDPKALSCLTCRDCMCCAWQAVRRVGLASRGESAGVQDDSRVRPAAAAGAGVGGAGRAAPARAGKAHDPGGPGHGRRALPRLPGGAHAAAGGARSGACPITPYLLLSPRRLPSKLRQDMPSMRDHPSPFGQEDTKEHRLIPQLRAARA